MAVREDGDVSGNHGATDYWIVKLSPDTTTKDVEKLASSNTNDINLKIEPNPASNYISISFYQGASSLVGNRSISIYNSLGIEMIFTKVSDTFKVSETSGSETSTINISTEDFPTGIYFLTLKSGSNFETKKFVVVR